MGVFLNEIELLHPADEHLFFHFKYKTSSFLLIICLHKGVKSSVIQHSAVLLPPQNVVLLTLISIGEIFVSVLKFEEWNLFHVHVLSKEDPTKIWRMLELVILKYLS